MLARTRRGMTLAEIMVSLALVSIMLVMAVSFVLLVTKNTRINAENDRIRQDLQKVEAGVESWVNAVLAEKMNLTCSDDKKTLTAETFSLHFSGKRLVGTLPSGKEMTIPTDRVTTIEFEVIKNDGKTLVFCDVTCENKEKETTVEYTFSILSRVGESVGE